MSSTFFDAGDLQRLDRERTLTEEAPRQLPAEDKTPDENEIQLEQVENEPMNDFDLMLKGVLEAIKRRL